MKNQKFHVLAFEWQPEYRKNIENALFDDAEITYENDPDAFCQKVDRHNYDAIFMGLQNSNSSTFNLLQKARKTAPGIPVIIISSADQAELIDEAIRHGAADFITDPFLPARIQLSMKKAIAERHKGNELAYLRRTQDVLYDFDNLVAETPSFKKTVEHLRKFAAFDSTLLLTGATGTGKSFLAGTVHFNSPRHEKPFIKVNCVNVSEQLLESELFGHEKGAFPGADKQRIGRLEQADGGTVFLDEIGYISVNLQAKILRILEEKRFEPLGGTRTIDVDVCLIIATNKNLATLMQTGQFREDLFYRINVLSAQLPPLVERPQCIVPLSRKLLRKIASSVQKPIVDFTPEALTLLTSYHWPGNIRQLANSIERAVILEDGPYITPPSLYSADEFQADSMASSKVLELHDNERTLILRALKECSWIQKKAADKLGISPRVMNYKIKKFNIKHPRWRKNKNR